MTCKRGGMSRERRRPFRRGGYVFCLFARSFWTLAAMRYACSATSWTSELLRPNTAPESRCHVNKFTRLFDGEPVSLPLERPSPTPDENVVGGICTVPDDLIGQNIVLPTEVSDARLHLVFPWRCRKFDLLPFTILLSLFPAPLWHRLYRRSRCGTINSPRSR